MIVAVVGEYVNMSGEAASKTDISFPGKQQEMLEKLLAFGKPVIAVLMNGRPLALSREDAHPYVTGQCPVYYNHPNTGRPGSRSKFTSRYIDAPFEALYPFGYGLSYTTFAYSDMEVIESEDALEVHVKVANTGNVDGTETVQLYMQDIAASIVRPVKELKAFKKVDLKAGESKDVVMILEKNRMGFYGDDMNYCLENGKFNIFIGGNSKDVLKQEIYVTF